MKTGLLVATVSVLLLVAAACGGGNARPTLTQPAVTPTPIATAEPAASPTATPTPTAGAEPGTPTPAPVYTLNDFVTILDDLALRVGLSTEIRAIPLLVEGTHLTLNGFSYLEHGVEVFVYPDSATLIADRAASIPEYLEVWLREGGWEAATRSFSRDNLLVVVISDNIGLTTTVEQAVAKLGAAPPSGAEPSATKTPAPPGRRYTIGDMVSALEGYGLYPDEERSRPTGFFSSTAGVNLWLSEFIGKRSLVQVFEYEDEATRLEETSFVTAAWMESLIHSDYIALPYVFSRGNLLVIVFTFHGGLLAVVEEAVATLP
jgi:hypothetical protein